MRVRKGSASLLFIVVLVTVSLAVSASGAVYFPTFADSDTVGLWLFDEPDAGTHGCR